MKKYLLLFASAAMLCFSACKEKEPISDDPTPQDGYQEKTFVVNVVLKDGVSNTYEGVVASMPGSEILDFLGLTESEFYAGMGTITGSAYPEPLTSQEGNTIMFGVATANNTDNLNWIPQSSNNIGHWFTQDGSICAWGDDAVFFTESLCEWGLDSPDAETYSDMWYFTVGCFPGRTKVGDTLKATEVFFITDDDDVEYYAYVQWNITIEEAEQVQLNVVGSETLNYETPFDDTYAHTPVGFDAGAVQSAIGISFEDADVYGVNSDGSFSLAPAKNFWFSVAGDVSSWGDGAGICINDDAGTNDWAWCMFPDEGLAGQTLKGAIAFVNPNTLNAYVVNVVVTVADVDYLAISLLVSYEEGEEEYELSEDNIAAIAAALGEESFDPQTIGTDVVLKGVNADGSIYDGGFTANNGYWFDMSGNVADWGTIAANDYYGSYIEYRGGNTFGCGFWGDPGDTNTVQIALVKGDAKAVLTFNLTVDEQKNFETTEAGTLTKSVTQTVAAGYGGEVVEITEAEVAALIDGTAEDWYLLDNEGTMNYTANGGFWFNAAGEVCEWGDGAIYIEPAENFPSLNTGIQADNGTGAGSYTAKVRIANPDSGKHVTITVTVTATE
mgnify:CR=1 FL=1